MCLSEWLIAYCWLGRGTWCSDVSYKFNLKPSHHSTPEWGGELGDTIQDLVPPSERQVVSGDSAMPGIVERPIFRSRRRGGGRVGRGGARRVERDTRRGDVIRQQQTRWRKSVREVFEQLRVRHNLGAVAEPSPRKLGREHAARH